MERITQGMFFIAIWLPVSSVVPAITRYIVDEGMTPIPWITIMEHYINLFLPLIGFVLIGFGAWGLTKTFRIRTSYAALNVMGIITIYVSLIYYHLIVSARERMVIYHLSIWLLLLTFIAPYVFMWGTGLTAVYILYLYQLKVKGIVYRKALQLLTLGLGWLVIMSIVFQFLTTLSFRLRGLSIYWILFIIYSALLVLSAGFVLIALGTRKLRKIEEV